MPKKYVPAPPMTYAQLAAKLAAFTPEQLAEPVRWWGVEKGGEVQSVKILECPYIDSGEGMEPLNAYEEDERERALKDSEDMMDAGTPILCVDDMVLAGDSK